ncbi:Imidazolonepropionase [Escherichia coli]|nr:Imidazolonepropionase [Escherichia coli]
MSGEHTLKAVRGSFIDVTRTVDNPEEIASALRFIEDGLLLIKQGKVEWFGEWEDGKHQIPDTIRVRDYRGKLIVPGFIDTHIHYPQSEMVGAYGEQLLEWLNKHTFPTERRYEDLETPARCRRSSSSSFYVTEPPRRWCLALFIHNPLMRCLKPPVISICV